MVAATVLPECVEPISTVGQPCEVWRTLVVDRLMEHSDRSLVVVAAPAGYGKTTLVRQWAARDRRPFAWLALEDCDNEPAALLASIIRALDEVEPFGDALAAPPWAFDAACMAHALHAGAALSSRRVPCVLVLDDVQHVTAQPALDVVGAVLAHLPRGSQLVLVGRSDPPLGSATALASTLRLGALDLAMDTSEGELLLSSAGVEIENTDLEALMQRTEGWAVGLSLAAVSLLEGGEPDAFTGSDRNLAEYMNREVFADLDAGSADFLLRTSVLEELTGSLCDAVVGRAGSAHVLDELDRSNGFVVALDRRGERYRYHHLFREWLRWELRRGDAELESELHRRAGEWFERRGRHGHAIVHALAADDVAGAGSIVWANTAVAIARGRTATVRGWLDGFTEDQIAAHPTLALAAAWIDVADGRAEEAAHWIWLATHGAGDQARSERGDLEPHLALLDAVLGAGDVARSQDDADRAFELESDPSLWRAVSCFYAGLTRMLAGDRAAARERFEEAAMRSAVLGPAVHAGCLAHLALLAADEGDWDAATAAGSRAHAYVEERGLTDYPPLAGLSAVWALVLAHGGDTNGARRAMERALRSVRALGQVAPLLRAETGVVLARASLATGDTARTRGLLRDVRPLLTGLPGALELHARVDELEGALRTLAETVVGPLALTPAELRVLRFLPTRLSMSEIAEQLFVSRNTVKSQAIAVYRKLAVSSRSAAVARALELGLLEA